MARHCVWIFLLTFCCSGVASAAALCDHQRGDEQKRPEAARPEDPPRWKWWLHPETRKDLGLSDKQVQKIDKIFEEFIPKQRERWHEIEKLDESLALITKESTADVTAVAPQIEKVEKLRADERTARAVMIYKIRLLLNPEQRIKVDAIRARLDEERRKQEEERKKQGKTDKNDR